MGIKRIAAALVSLSLLGFIPLSSRAAARPAARARAKAAPAARIPRVPAGMKPFRLPVGSYLGPEPVPQSFFEKGLEKLRAFSHQLKFVSQFKDPLKSQDASLRRLREESSRTFDFTKEYQAGAEELPALAGESNPVARITGALSRRHSNPRPIKKMWFVYETPEEKDDAGDVLERIRQENPGVEIRLVAKDGLFSKKDIGDFGDLAGEKAGGLFKRLLEEKVELVVGSNYGIYETFRSLRDRGYARELPFGYAGRRFVSIDVPRESLDPADLSDPRKLPHRKALILRSVPAPAKAAALIHGETGMAVASLELKTALKAAQAYAKTEKLGRDLNKILDKLTALSFQALRGDNRRMRALRKDSQLLAAYLEREKVDALVIEDARAAAVVGEMKREGYHVSLPVIWRGKTGPGDASGITAAAKDASWPELSAAVSRAVKAPRLPDNFGKNGGVPVSGYEKTIESLTRRPALPGQPRGYRVHVLMTYGNGVYAKGDNNQYGHLGLGIEDENGVVRVWTVQYNDDKGGAFTGGGLDKESMLTLGEYLYGSHYLPQTAGQAGALGETYTAPVLDLQLDVDEAARDAMFEMAARLNLSHLQGKDEYSFVNSQGKTNCASLVCDILRAGGFIVPDSGTHIPADKMVQLFRGFVQRLLWNKAGAESFDLTLFDRTYHSASDHYRIANTPTGTNLINFKKPWSQMKAREILASFLRHPLEFLNIPKEIDALAGLAARRVMTLPNQRELTVLENPQSPIYKIRESSRRISELRASRPAIDGERQALLARVLQKLHLENFRVNPGQDLAEFLSGESKGARLTRKDAREVEAWLSRYRELDKALAVNEFDELLHVQKLLFMKLQLADAGGRYRHVLEPLQEIYLRILKFRGRLEGRERALSRKEVETLVALNQKVAEDLKALTPKILAQIDLPAGIDIRRVLGDQVSEQTLRLLEKEYAAGPGAAPARSPKSAKKL